MEPVKLISLDATQMGTQTCAALLGDRATAKLVNMVPLKNKADVYSKVAMAMKARLKSMKTEDCPTIKKLYLNNAKQLFHRSVWKRPTMTILYGATRTTYANHLREDIEVATGVKLSTSEARFIGGITEEVLTEVLPAAVLLMQSLTGVVKTVVRHTDKPFIFTTATGAVFKAAKYKSSTYHKLGVTSGFGLDIKVETGDINVKATAKSAAAQLIQSFDAVIAGEIQCEMDRLNIPVLSVFDSWSVPVGYTSTLIEVARAAYIKHLAEDPLKSFYDEAKARYPILWKHPKLFLKRGNYDIKSELPKCKHFIGL